MKRDAAGNGFVATIVIFPLVTFASLCVGIPTVAGVAMVVRSSAFVWYQPLIIFVLALINLGESSMIQIMFSRIWAYPPLILTWLLSCAAIAAFAVHMSSLEVAINLLAWTLPFAFCCLEDWETVSRQKQRAIQEEANYTGRRCPRCLKSCPSYRKTCRHCQYEIGRAIS